MELRISKEKLQSDEELYFAWYMEQLWNEGYIHGYEEHPITFNLTDTVSYKSIDKLLKTKINYKDQTLLREDTYTPDFAIFWSEKAEGIFYETFDISKASAIILDKTTPFIVWEGKTFEGVAAVTNYEKSIENSGVSYVDVKSAAARRFSGNLSTTYTFPIEQKWVMDKFGVYVQKIIPNGKNNCLFGTTFTPDRYLTNNVLKTPRTIHHKTEKLYSYVREKSENYGKIKRRYHPTGVLFSK